MSWNLGLQINNLATKLNNLSGSVIANPLVSTLNANNFSITNANNVALQSLKDSSLSNGTNNQVLNASLTGLTVWKTPVASTVFYVDATSGNDLDKGSSIFPLATIQSAIDKCGGNTTYYTIYVNPGTYPENLIISTPRINLVGVQSSQNTKSVFISSVNITTQGQSGPSLDIIAIQNFVIGGLSNVSPAINIANFSNYGGYSLYINNCELLTPQPNSVINFSPTQLNTRLYISRTNINNVINTATASQIMVNIARGELWQCDYVNITNRGPVGSASTDATPLLIGANAKIISGITNTNITSDNQGICFRTNQSNGVFSITNSYFSFIPISAGNLYSAFIITAKNTINLNNNIFINNGATTTTSQQPFILLSSGSIVYARGNSFNVIYAPVSTAQAVMYPVGNYSTNSTQSGFIYSTNVYSNGSVLYSPSPFYPFTGTVISRPPVIDSIGPTKSLLVYGNGTNTGTPQLYYKNGSNTAYVQTGLSGKDIHQYQNYVSYKDSTLRPESTGTPVWGNTSSTYANMYFRETGIYFITFNINTAVFGDLIYASVNKNYLLSNATQAINDYPTVLVSNQTVDNSYTALVSCTVIITVCGTQAVPESGDYLVFGFYATKSGNTIFNAFRNQLSVYKIA
jgi:hypothetical protein